MSGEANSKLTEPRVEAALNALRMGATRNAAAGAAGVTRVTFWRWMQDETLRNEVEKAEDSAEASYTAAVANAVPKSWQAAAWWLERRKHTDYAQRQHVSVDLTATIRQMAADAGIEESEAIAAAERILANAR